MVKEENIKEMGHDMKYNHEKKTNIGILTFPMSLAGITPLSNLVDILYPLSNDIYLITGNEGYIFFKDDERIHIYGIKHERGANALTRIIRYVYTQLKASYKLARIAKSVDIWIFFIGADNLVFPMLTVKLLKKQCVLIFAGSSICVGRAMGDRLYKPLAFLLRINCALSDRIIVYSSKLVKEWDLEKHKNKISIAHRHFIDFDKFKIKKKFDERRNLVGYIGRLSEEKGVLNFVNAVPEILGERSELKFLIGGDGQLRDKIKKYLDEERLNDKVKLKGWIPHDELPLYLNELRLIVLPSYTEGLPNIMIEAMACGTPVLATPVGTIPDVIKDGETGFIMENNTPECIAENVIKALWYTDLEGIVKNARDLVERDFTYGAAVGRFKEIIDVILGD